MTADQEQAQAAAAFQAALQLHTRGMQAEAATAYEALLQAGHPQTAEILHLFGLLRGQQRNHVAARRLYEHALTLGRPVKLVLSYALCLQMLGLKGKAVPFFDEVIRADPGNIVAHSARATILADINQFSEALRSIDVVAVAKPHVVNVRVGQLFAAGMTCRWLPGEDEAFSALLAATTSPDVSVNPYPLTFFLTDAALQKEWGERRAAAIRRRPAPELPPVTPEPPDAAGRIRVGYLSQDFRNHPVGYIMPELFELHDRSRFDIRLLSCGHDDGSAIHHRYAAIKGFTDLHGLSRVEQEVAIRAAGLDILVDLQGHTTGHFTELLSRRPAPVQIHWIGYPGSIGGGLVDYIIADRQIVPDGAEHFYSEQIIRLPHCYQPNNRQRTVDEPLTRAEYGLPETGIVFCCFTRPVKIRPVLFTAWMEILRAVPGSVLWLYAPEQDVIDNLRRTAADHGIAPERLVFAGGIAQPRYLARYRAADLTLDTYPYGSHSTGSDSLWAGCPLLTLRGETFPSRVAGSIVTAAGLPELATDSLADYTAMAIRLGRHPEELAALRRRLQDSLPTMPLFDTPQMARDLEAAFTAVWQRHRDGQPPQHVSLPPVRR